MKPLLITLIKIFFRIAFAYGLVLLFANKVNPMEWANIAKIIFVIIVFVLLTAD